MKTALFVLLFAFTLQTRLIYDWTYSMENVMWPALLRLDLDPELYAFSKDDVQA